MSEETAYETFKAIRWAETDGKPFCGACGCAEVYEIKTRKLFKCKACLKQFSVTSGTIFASRKLQIRDYLAAIAIFVNGAKGISALQLSRDLGVQYKTAFVLAHKLREAMGSTGPDSLEGVVEVDGAYFGGYVKPANRKEDRVDRRLAENRTGKRQVVVIMRERDGKARSLSYVCKSESDAVPVICTTVEPDSVVHADESSAWDTLAAWYETRRINHKKEYSTVDACTNWAESFFSRMRRAEIGVHHRIAGPYLSAYAGEMAWRENHRRVANGGQYDMVVSAALHHPVSRQWKGYWQRGAEAAA